MRAYKRGMPSKFRCACGVIQGTFQMLKSHVHTKTQMRHFSFQTPKTADSWAMFSKQAFVTREVELALILKS